MSAQREEEEALRLNVELKRETVGVLAHASGQGCPRSQRQGASESKLVMFRETID